MLDFHTKRSGNSQMWFVEAIRILKPDLARSNTKVHLYSLEYAICVLSVMLVLVADYYLVPVGQGIYVIYDPYHQNSNTIITHHHIRK